MHDGSERAFWVTGPMKGELRDAKLGAPRADEVLVRTLYGAISRGTESLVWRGAVPESEYARMRAPFQEGAFPYPLKYGYITVGTVEEGPPELLHQTVFCLHPHQERFVVPASAVTVLPEKLPPARAVLAANMETAINGVWDAMPLIGERVFVIGAGVVGMLVAHLISKIPGTVVTLLDPLQEKAIKANELGLTCIPPEEASDEADLIIHASGNPKGLERALELAAQDGRIVEMSWYGDRRAEVPLGGAFHSKRLKLISSQVGRLPPGQTARWDHARRMALALELLTDPIYNALISGEDSFGRLPDIMTHIAESPNVLCHLIRYGVD
jgi:NADPH:quinone reductase-like Zn-dependent oxidoreductase